MSGRESLPRSRRRQRVVERGNFCTDRKNERRFKRKKYILAVAHYLCCRKMAIEEVVRLGFQEFFCDPNYLQISINIRYHLKKTSDIHNWIIILKDLFQINYLSKKFSWNLFSAITILLPSIIGLLLGKVSFHKGSQILIDITLTILNHSNWMGQIFLSEIKLFKSNRSAKRESSRKSYFGFRALPTKSPVREKIQIIKWLQNSLHSENRTHRKPGQHALEGSGR